jgi:hypothetical protein
MEIEPTTSSFWDKIGGRKFVLCLLTQVGASALLYFGKLDVTAYSTITIAIVGGYIAGNVTQKLKT